MAPQPTLTNVSETKLCQCNAGREKAKSERERAIEQRTEKESCWGGTVEAERLLVRVRACSPIGLACLSSEESERDASERAATRAATEKLVARKTVATVRKNGRTRV